MDPNTVNVHSSVDAGYLAKALAKMLRIKREYEELMADLGITVYPVCSWYGNAITNWIHDLTVRLKLVVNAARIAELNKAKNELISFLSQEDRLTNTLEGLSKLFKTKSADS